MKRLKAIIFIVYTMIAGVLGPVVPSNADSVLPQAASEPPKEVAASPQPWLAHMDWFCPPNTPFDAKAFIRRIESRMNQLGNGGWELVGVNEITLAGNSCLVATYKAPKKSN